MENFQLYRTNIFLGGQMKLDLILDSSDNVLSVSDIHLRPISNNMLYSYTENLLNNSHQDNVKSYYNSIKDKFYVESLDYEFTSNWPIESNKENTINYCNVYDMGCKRMKYHIYNKQFEFFCPLWVERAEKSIEFKINVLPLNADIILAQKSLKINLDTPSNRFDKYISNYFKDSGINYGDDNVININFKDTLANISGLNARTGVFCKTDISSIIYKLKEIERPLLETDSLIINSFANYSMIAKQLLNFNLCFNIEDLISKEISELIKGNLFNVSVDILVDGKKLEIKDFYTNYEFINRSTNLTNNELNVLDYLHDNKSIELMNKNKFAQNICHWSLLNDKEYIFNLYEGFSSVFVEKDKEGNTIYKINEHQYGNTPNTSSTISTNDNNASMWINNYKIKYWSELDKLITDKKYIHSKSTLITNNTKYINGLKYNNIEVENSLYMLSVCLSKSLYSVLNSNYKLYGLSILDIVDGVKIYYKDDYYIIVTYDQDKLAYKTFSRNILDITIDNKIVKTLKSMFSSMIDANIIMIDNTIKWQTSGYPTTTAEEVFYIKDEGSSIYVVRHDGEIKPTFINGDDNVFYCKDIVENLSSSKYVNYLNTGYEPLYPSIDYCAINKIKDWSYVSKSSDIKTPLEYSWFNNNVCMLLNAKIEFSFISSLEEFEENFNINLMKKIKELYHCNDEYANYITTIYNRHIYWEYNSEDNINTYKYFITLKLK